MISQMQYQLLEAVSCKLLENMVVELLHQGWMPLGGVAACAPPNVTPLYVQAMVRDNASA
jgi:hypothetical protein